MMNDDADDIPSGKPAGPGRKPLALRPVLWLGGIVVAALGIALTNVLVPQFGKGINQITQSGDAVNVDDVSIWRIGSQLALPSFSAGKVGTLNAQAWEEQEQWLVDHGAVDMGSTEVRLALSGKRADGVRIVDISPVSDCSQPPYSGALFVSPAAGADTITRVKFDLDDPRPVAKTSNYVDGAYRDEPYFASNTMSLQQDEQQVFIVTATTQLHFCRFELELSVLDGGTMRTQMVDNHGRPFQVTAPLTDRRQWGQVFLGGVMCAGRYVAATPDWFQSNGENLDDVVVCDSQGHELPPK
ncbi:MAG: hypothetical protein JWM23_180 [Microbacteriaceae bacterium]|jgi:hypothetical protein|nr:hypothetical protein [Microbacteriaceae bacterium]